MKISLVCIQLREIHAMCAFICVCFETMLIGLNPLPCYASVPYLWEWLHHSSKAVQRRKGYLCACSLDTLQKVVLF